METIYHHRGGRYDELYIGVGDLFGTVYVPAEKRPIARHRPSNPGIRRVQGRRQTGRHHCPQKKSPIGAN